MGVLDKTEFSWNSLFIQYRGSFWGKISALAPIRLDTGVGVGEPDSLGALSGFLTTAPLFLNWGNFWVCVAHKGTQEYEVFSQRERIL